MDDTIETNEENAPKFWEWIQAKRGLALWRSQNLGNPNRSWTTPAVQIDGTPMLRPHWSTAEKPNFIEHDPAKVKVYTMKEVKRFRVAIRRGGGFSYELTTAASRKLRAAMEQFTNPTYKFDFETQEAVIFVDETEMSLLEWAGKNNLT